MYAKFLILGLVGALVSAGCANIEADGDSMRSPDPPATVTQPESSHPLGEAGPCEMAIYTSQYDVDGQLCGHN